MSSRLNGTLVIFLYRKLIIFHSKKQKKTALRLASLENKPYLCPQNAIKCVQALTNFKY